MRQKFYSVLLLLFALVIITNNTSIKEPMNDNQTTESKEPEVPKQPPLENKNQSRLLTGGIRCGYMTDNSSCKSTGEVGHWKGTHLVYKIHNYPDGIDHKDTDSIIKESFLAWSRHIDMTFDSAETDDKVNIHISFLNGTHGDDAIFDGPGGILAHTFYPDAGGAIHFDASEPWTFSGVGINLARVAVHEIGHALGLVHSQREDSVMYCHYHDDNITTPFELYDDDINRIQHIYGKNKENSDHIRCLDHEQNYWKEYCDACPHVETADLNGTETNETSACSGLLYDQFSKQYCDDCHQIKNVNSNSIEYDTNSPCCEYYQCIQSYYEQMGTYIDPNEDTTELNVLQQYTETNEL